ncbi:hypothetical protein LTR99_008840 [Exophiala xenobiotica]|uniref:BTB domain-containing protein n=1 Tax=Vermiconidia calcicola TaxID=1690605 RepID=A0AAV9Q5U0_9PEZI|nr:hypothetical protein H2202_007188 [Exophiala xenobiotica]KAK5533484.1 hypothetical protein LTR25_007350 [Vermiconidia calcicola]KAK5542945.1 hypothetical protein LTR23_005270 [Chaetothyriales sp. CCFEE 6169]KAK5190485.1 hypothetical protein LTR92_009533 [Exophiala xenobiotica]KAK5203942.1 hypothetical protein LTR41_010399 [Exophiala xenobiotica]
MSDNDGNPPSDGHPMPTPATKRFALSKIVFVCVGEQKLRYALHESILVSECPFFEKCLSSDMKEAQDGEIHLPEDNPSAFDVLVQWMYTKHIAQNDATNLALAYNLADKLCMPALQNIIIDCVRKKPMIPGSLRPDFVHWIWNRTTEGSKLRDLYVDKLHYHLSMKPETYKIGDGQHASAFRAILQDVDPLVSAVLWKFVEQGKTGKSVTAHRNLQDPASLVGCVYHIHKNGEKCDSSADYRGILHPEIVSPFGRHSSS